MDFDISPLIISLKVAVISTVITFFAGIFMAKFVYRMKHFKHLADAFLSLPLVLPPTAVGFFLLVLFGRNTAFGRALSMIGFDVIFTLRGAVIAASVVSFPIMYRTTLGAFEQIDTELIDAARTLGFGENQIFFKVWLPLSWPGIAAATTLTFARAFGEFGATIMIAGNIPGKTRTMSLAVYSAMQGGNRELAYKWVIIILLMSFTSLVLLNYWNSLCYSRDERYINVKSRLFSRKTKDGMRQEKPEKASEKDI